jgi:hypothetical protein
MKRNYIKFNNFLMQIVFLDLNIISLMTVHHQSVDIFMITYPKQSCKKVKINTGLG